MLGLLGAIAAGLLFASIVASKKLTEKWNLPIAIAVSGLLFLWARATIAWELQGFPSLSENSWETAFVLAGVGAALRYLDGALARKIIVPAVLIVAGLVSWDHLSRHPDPEIRALVEAVAVYSVLVFVGLLVLTGRISLPKFMKKEPPKKGGGGDHGH